MNEEWICKIRDKRLAKNMRQNELAEQVGVRRETIIRLEKGLYNPSVKLALNIAHVLGTTVEELYVLQIDDEHSRG